MPIQKEIYLDGATTNAIAPHAARHPIRIPMEELHPTPKTTIYAATFSIRLNRCREKCGRGIHAVKPWAIFFPSRRVVRNQPLSFSTCAGHWLRRGEEVERVASTPDDISRGTAISKRVLRPELNADKSPRLAGSGKQSCPPQRSLTGAVQANQLIDWLPGFACSVIHTKLPTRPGFVWEQTKNRVAKKQSRHMSRKPILNHFKQLIDRKSYITPYSRQAVAIRQRLQRFSPSTPTTLSNWSYLQFNTKYSW